MISTSLEQLGGLGAVPLAEEWPGGCALLEPAPACGPGAAVCVCVCEWEDTTTMAAGLPRRIIKVHGRGWCCLQARGAGSAGPWGSRQGLQPACPGWRPRRGPRPRWRTSHDLVVVVTVRTVGASAGGGPTRHVGRGG